VAKYLTTESEIFYAELFMLRDTAIISFVGKYHIQNTVASLVHILIYLSLGAALVCFVFAGLEYLRSKISAKDTASLKRSLVFIILGIFVGIGFLVLWIVGIAFIPYQKVYRVWF